MAPLTTVLFTLIIISNISCRPHNAGVGYFYTVPKFGAGSLRSYSESIFKPREEIEISLAPPTLAIGTFNKYNDNIVFKDETVIRLDTGKIEKQFHLLPNKGQVQQKDVENNNRGTDNNWKNDENRISNPNSIKDMPKEIKTNNILFTETTGSNTITDTFEYETTTEDDLNRIGVNEHVVATLLGR